jgi:hypothetical protein
MTLDELRHEYAPYNTLAAFEAGFEAYARGDYRNPFDGQPHQGAHAQAWERGIECAARWDRIVAR